MAVNSAGNDVLLNIVLPDTQEILNSFGQILDYLNKTQNTLSTLKKGESFAKAVGGDAGELKKIRNDIASIQTSFERTFAVMKKGTESSGLAADDLRNMTKSAKMVNDTFLDLNNQIIQSSAVTNDAALDFDALYSGLSNNLSEFSEEMLKVRRAQLQVTDAKEFKGYKLSLNNIKYGITEIKEAFQEVLIAEAKSAKGISLGLEALSTKDLLEYTQQYNDEQQKKIAADTAENKKIQQRVGEYNELGELIQKRIPGAYNKVAVSAIELNNQIDELELALRKTSDPTLVKALSEKLTQVKEQMTAVVGTMSTSDAIAFWNEQKRGASESLDTQSKLRLMIEGSGNSAKNNSSVIQQIQRDVNIEYNAAIVAIGKMKAEQILLQRAFREANDPDALTVMKTRYDEVTKRIEEQNKWLQENRDLQKADLAGGQRGMNPSRMIEGFKNLSAGVNSLKVIGDAIGGNTDKITLWNAGITNLDYAMNTNKVTLGGMITAFGQIAEKQSATSQSIADFQKGITNARNKFSDWGKTITAQNAALTQSGASLTGWQKMLGGAAKGAEGFSGILGGVERVAGIAGAGIQGIQIGFDLMDAATGRSAEAIQKRIDAIHKEAEANTRLTNVINTGSIEGLNREIQARKMSIQGLEDERDKMIDNALSNTSHFDMWRTAFTNNLQKLIDPTSQATPIFGAAGEKINEMNIQLRDMNIEIEKLAADWVPEAVKRAKEWNDAIQKGLDISRELTKYEDELITIRMEALDNQSKLEKGLNDLQDSSEKEKEDTNKRRYEEDVKRLNDHLQSLSDSETQHNNQIRDMRYSHLKELQNAEQDYNAESLKEIEQQNKALNEIDTNYAEDVAKAEEEKQKSIAEDQIRFAKQMAKMDEDYIKEKIKREKDLKQQLFEAELDNDALQFFKLKIQGKKAEEEAQQQYQENRSEEQKNFAEEQADKQKQYEEAAADRKKQYEESRAESIANFEEQQKERAAQYQAQLQQSKDAFAEKLKEENFQYQESRAKMVEDFKKREEELTAARAKEDADAIERTAAKRKELEDQFALEVEYYKNREVLLNQYLDAMKNTASTYDALKMTGNTIDDTERQQLTPIITNELKKLQDIVNGGGTLSREEEGMLNSLQNILTAFSNTQSGQSATISSMDRVQLSELIDYLKGQAASSVNSEYYGQLQYKDKAGNYGMAKAGSVYETALQQNQEYLDEFGMLQTQYGYQTADEIKKQNALREFLLKQQGQRDLGALKNNTQDANNAILSGFYLLNTERQQNQDEEADALARHFYNQQGTSSSGYSDLSEQSSTYYTDSLGMQSENNTLQLDTQGVYYNELGLLTDGYNTNYLQSEEAINQESLNNLDAYGMQFKDKNVRTYMDTVAQIAASSKSGTAQIVQIYATMNNAIATSATQALNQIKSQASSLSSKAKPSSGNNSVFGFKPVGSSRGGTLGIFNGAKPTLFAKGGFVKEPTEIIAGEDLSEVILPFDESKGLPDTIANQFMKSIYELQDKAGYQLNANTPSNDGLYFKALLSAIGNLNQSMNLTIENMEVGSNISREEIRMQFGEIQQVLVDTIRQHIE